MRRDDLIGWVRSDQQANTAVLADEIARLSKENAHLRSQVSDKNQNILMNGLTLEEIKTILEEKNLLRVIKNNKDKFIGSFPAHDEDERDAYDEMYRLGFFIYNQFQYAVSDSGHIFLNLLEAEGIRERNA